MEQTLNLTINRLPALTWHHLGMNQTSLEQVLAEGEGTLTIETPDGVTQPAQDDLPAIGGGMGPDMDTLVQAAGVPVVYTGPVDRYFDYSLGELKWRTVDFKEVRYDEGDHFGCPVMNFSDADVPYTRAIEFKNFNPERAASQNPDRTVVWEEYSRFAERGDEPYYPINTEADKALYARYEELAKAEPLTVFGGRLGTYKYYDMHQVIDTALTAYEEQVEPLLKK